MKAKVDLFGGAANLELNNTIF